jgi:hypothetical protein
MRKGNLTMKISPLDLFKLVRSQPAVVNGVKIQDTARSVLWTLASYCDGDCETFVGLEQVALDVARHMDAVKDAITNLNTAGLLLKTRRQFNKVKGTGSTAYRTLNRELIERGALQTEDEAYCRRLLKAVLNSEEHVTCGPMSRGKSARLQGVLKRLSPGLVVYEEEAEVGDVLIYVYQREDVMTRRTKGEHKDERKAKTSQITMVGVSS